MEPVSFSLFSDHAGTRKNYLLVKVELYKVARVRKLALEMRETPKALSAQQGGSADRKGSHQAPHPAGEHDVLAFFFSASFFFFSCTSFSLACSQAGGRNNFGENISAVLGCSFVFYRKDGLDQKIGSP